MFTVSPPHATWRLACVRGCCGGHSLVKATMVTVPPKHCEQRRQRAEAHALLGHDNLGTMPRCIRLALRSAPADSLAGGR